MPKINQSLDKFYSTQLNEKEVEILSATLARFLNSYVENRDKFSLDQWLENQIQKELPNVDINEIKATTHDIIEIIKCINEEKADLLKAKSKGVSIKSWLMERIKKFINPDDLSAVTKDLKKANIYDTLELARRSGEDIEAIEPEIIEKEIENSSPIMDKIQEFAEESLKRTALGGAQSASKYILENPDFKFSNILKVAAGGVKDEAKAIIDETIKGTDNSDKLKIITGGALSVLAKTMPTDRMPIKTGSVMGSIASSSIENIKTLNELADGKISTTEAIGNMAINTASTAAGTIVGEATGKVGMAVGSTIGGTLGAIFGPPGVAAGAAIGGAIGKFAGKVIGSKVVQGAAKVAKKVASAAVEGVKAVGRGIGRVASAAWGGVKSMFSGIASIFSW